MHKIGRAYSAIEMDLRNYGTDTLQCVSVISTRRRWLFNIELDKVADWLLANKLTLNVKKSKFMIISQKHNIPPVSLTIKENGLEKCSSYKYLGIFLDQELNWSTHIQYVTEKSTESLWCHSQIETLC